jgi:hypothetical protein
MEITMSSTSLSISTPGRAWDGLEIGSAEWQANQEKIWTTIAAAGGEILMGGYVAGIGRFVNVIRYPNAGASTQVLATLSAAQLNEFESSGPFVTTPDWQEKFSPRSFMAMGGFLAARLVVIPTK